MNYPLYLKTVTFAFVAQPCMIVCICVRAIKKRIKL